PTCGLAAGRDKSGLVTGRSFLSKTAEAKASSKTLISMIPAKPHLSHSVTPTRPWLKCAAPAAVQPLLLLGFLLTKWPVLWRMNANGAVVFFDRDTSTLEVRDGVSSRSLGPGIDESDYDINNSGQVIHYAILPQNNNVESLMIDNAEIVNASVFGPNGGKFYS